MDKTDWLKIIIPLLAPLIAWIIYKRNTRQKLKERQQEAIADLINNLNENPIEFTFGEVSKNSMSGVVLSKTLIEVGNQNMNSFKNEFDDDGLYFHYQSNRIVGIKKFIDNSYLPRRIKEELRKFHPTSYDNIDKKSITDREPVVILSTNHFVELPPFELERNQNSNQLKDPIAPIAFESWLSFKTCCHNLVIEINRHLDKINSSDLKV